MCNHLKDAFEGSPFESAIAWFSLIIAILPAACIPLGLKTVLNILLGELFPTDIRSISVGIVKAVGYVAGYANMMAYPMVSNANAFQELMFGYGALAAFMTMWAIITVKETDSMSLVEIEELYKGGQNKFSRLQNGFKKQKVHNAAVKENKANKDSDMKTQEILESAPLLKD